MKSRIFILNSDDIKSDDLLTDIIRRTFAQSLASEDAIGQYKSIKEASPYVTKAFSDVASVYFFVEKKIFSETKKAIVQAFGLTPEPHASVLEKMGERANENELTAYHAMLPKGCKPFVTDTGDYSGFASTKGKQTVVFLPFDLEDTAKLLYSQVIPFMNSVYDTNLETAFSEHIYAPLLAKSIVLSDVRVALANTHVTEHFMEYTSVCSELQERIKKSPLSEARRNTDPKTYVVNQSIAAAEFLGLPYGLAVSNAYYRGNDANGTKTVYIAVTNDTQTVVRVATSRPEENNTDFLNRCFGEACKLLAEIMDADAGRAKQQKIPTERSANKKQMSKKTFILFTVILVVLIVLICGFGVLYFKLNSYSLKDWFIFALGLFGMNLNLRM